MTHMITLGWWIVPVCFTIIVYTVAWVATDKNSRGMLAGIDGLFYFGLSTIVSLIAWLVWALAA